MSWKIRAEEAKVSPVLKHLKVFVIGVLLLSGHEVKGQGGWGRTGVKHSLIIAIWLAKFRVRRLKCFHWF